MKGFVRKLRRAVNTFIAKRRVAAFGHRICVNKKSVFSRETHLGNNCHFNGIVISGNGKVTIGDNFHSGENVRFITDIHNYEGDAIPYDSTLITKQISICENVWIGTNVLVLGGVTIGCLLYTSPSPRDQQASSMPSSA